MDEYVDALERVIEVQDELIADQRNTINIMGEIDQNNRAIIENYRLIIIAKDEQIKILEEGLNERSERKT